MVKFVDEKRLVFVLNDRHIEIQRSTTVKLIDTNLFAGAIPVVTRNIQERGTLAAKNIIQNPWRHNVVYKLEAPYVHLSNPSERVLDCLLHSQLSQPPLIYVKRKYVLEKWHSKVDLRSLTRANHNRWYNENVLGN